jgi:hypothetical protein
VLIQWRWCRPCRSSGRWCRPSKWHWLPPLTGGPKAVLDLIGLSYFFVYTSTAVTGGRAL